jgi:hypothetical protein
MERNDTIYDWVAKIISTCTHDFHFEAVDRLLELYYEREKDDIRLTELRMLKKIKWDEIHDILN